MTNRLMNLDGTKPIMENWDDLNEGFANAEAELDAAAAVSEGIQAEVTAHKESTAAHAAEHIAYTGPVAGAGNLKAAVDSVQEQLNQAVIEGDSSPAANQAKVSSTGVTYDTLKDRLDTERAELSEQLAETTKIDDLMSNQVIYGLVPQTSAGLTSNILDGLAFVSGKRVTKGAVSKTYNPSKDTYVDISSAGVYSFVEVANGASFPAITADSARVARVVTNATSIVTVDVYGSNTYFGYSSGAANTKGWKNTFLGYYAGLSNTEGSYGTFLGYYAGHLNTTGNQNTFVGYGCGRGNTEGNYNVFLGFQTGHLNTTGNQNTALGYMAGEANLTGQDNVFVGFEAGFVNTASFNAFIGSSAGIHNTSGTRNTFLGTQAGANNTTANDNVYLGYQSGLLSTGVWNTAVGASSLNANTTGYLNTAIGFNAGSKVVGGNSNTFIGADAGNNAAQVASVTNSTAIGAGAYTTLPNSIQLGDSNVDYVFTHGSFEVQDVGEGFICKSPNGARHRITVSDTGEIVVTGA